MSILHGDMLLLCHAVPIRIYGMYIYIYNNNIYICMYVCMYVHAYMYIYIYICRIPKKWGLQHVWCILENLIKKDDLGVPPLFQEIS